MQQLFKNIGQSALFLLGFALIGAITLSLVNAFTVDRIAENQRQKLLRQLNVLVDAKAYNNSLLEDFVVLPKADFNSASDVTVYRARMDNHPIAAIFVVGSPNGYSGTINMVVGLNKQQVITGLRVISHKETPGLGDRIEIEKDDWVLSFDGKSLGNPEAKGWAVKKDGGEFDQFTGATITPRTIVNSTRRVLEWSQQHFDELFTMPSTEIKS